MESRSKRALRSERPKLARGRPKRAREGAAEGVREKVAMATAAVGGACHHERAVHDSSAHDSSVHGSCAAGQGLGQSVHDPMTHPRMARPCMTHPPPGTGRGNGQDGGTHVVLDEDVALAGAGFALGGAEPPAVSPSAVTLGAAEVVICNPNQERKHERRQLSHGSTGECPLPASTPPKSP